MLLTGLIEVDEFGKLVNLLSLIACTCCISVKFSELMRYLSIFGIL